MLRVVPFLALVAASLVSLSCADDTIVQTAEVSVKVADNVDFTQFETFSVVTKDMVDPPPDLDEDHEAFNDLVNELIVEAMQAEPVCLEFIPPEETSDQNQPDLWGANALGQTSEGGYVYQCCGGWWWGWWGWVWDPCAYWCPTYVEFDAGNLLVPVMLPGDPGDAEAVFAGLARSVSGTGPDVETKVRQAIEVIFSRWPDKRQCSP
jgi:hypothetical protein